MGRYTASLSFICLWLLALSFSGTSLLVSETQALPTDLSQRTTPGSCTNVWPELERLSMGDERLEREFTDHCSWRPLLRSVWNRLYPGYRAERRCSSPERPFLFTSQKERPFQIELRISRSDEIQAYSLRGNFEEDLPATVVLSEGLLRSLQSPAELAFILGHEVSHLRLDHFAPELPNSVLSSTQKALLTKYHQEWEFTADHHAITEIKHAGFETLAATSVMRRLKKYGYNAGPRHPDVEKRIRALEMNSSTGTVAMPEQRVSAGSFSADREDLR